MKEDIKLGILIIMGGFLIIFMLVFCFLVASAMVYELFIDKDYYEYDKPCYDKYGSEIKELTCKDITACSKNYLKYMNHFRCGDLKKYNMTLINDSSVSNSEEVERE